MKALRLNSELAKESLTLGRSPIPGLVEKGYSFLNRRDFVMSPALMESLERFRGEYNTFPIDNHLNDGEGQRTRRYGRFCIDPQTLELGVFPHAPFFQEKRFDVLYGDIHREFSSLNSSILNNTFFLELLALDFAQFPLTEAQYQEPFEISAHLIRISAVSENQIGRPAPEGIHRDGYTFGAIHLVGRQNVQGAENRIYNLDKKVIDSGYLLQPLDSLLIDDRRIFHGVQPFTAEAPQFPGHRDILILLFQPLSESPQAIQQPMPLPL